MGKKKKVEKKMDKKPLVKKSAPMPKKKDNDKSDDCGH